MDANLPESVNLVKAFGPLEPDEITNAMGYHYLETCVLAKRPEKGNKEIALARLILEFGVCSGSWVRSPWFKGWQRACQKWFFCRLNGRGLRFE